MFVSHQQILHGKFIDEDGAIYIKVYKGTFDQHLVKVIVVCLNMTHLYCIC